MMRGGEERDDVAGHADQQGRARSSRRRPRRPRAPGASRPRGSSSMPAIRPMVLMSMTCFGIPQAVHSRVRPIVGQRRRRPGQQALGRIDRRAWRDRRRRRHRMAGIGIAVEQLDRVVSGPCINASWILPLAKTAPIGTHAVWSAPWRVDDEIRRRRRTGRSRSGAPRRPNPVMTSSKTSRMPCRSQIARRRWR